MDQRIDMLEREVSEIKTEIAVMRGDRLRREDLKESEQRLAAVEARLAVIEARLTGLEARFTALESKLSDLETRMAAVEVRLTLMERELEKLRVDVTTLFGLLREHSERLAAIETAIAQIQATQATFVTKSELKAELSKLEARMKTWAIASVLTTITAITGIQIAIATLIR